MTKKALILAAIPAMLLCGCAKKCTFEEFVKAVSEIEMSKDDELEAVKVKGSFVIDGKEYKVSEKITKEGFEDASEEAMMAMEIMSINHVSLYAIAENKDFTYYAGSTFKVKSDKVVMEWDKYGMCTKIDGEVEIFSETYTVDLTAKYSY